MSVSVKNNIEEILNKSLKILNEFNWLINSYVLVSKSLVTVCDVSFTVQNNAFLAKIRQSRG